MLKADKRGSSRSRWQFLLVVLVLTPFVLTVLWECGHHVRFGHFFGYGYHVDLVLDHSDIGVPDLHTFHCLRVTNYTIHALHFEGVQLPSGTTDSEILYHNRVEKWDEQAHAWSPVYDSAEASDPSLSNPNTVKSVRPGGSIYPTSCKAVLGYEGVHNGDTVRLVALTSYSKAERFSRQLVFYSPAFVINEKSAGALANQDFEGRLRGTDGTFSGFLVKPQKPFNCPNSRSALIFERSLQNT